MSALEGTEQPIEFDPTVVAGDDNDSVFGGQSVEGSTASLTSSIWEQRTVLGRAYQASKTTEYWAPNDDKHVEAFDVACVDIALQLVLLSYSSNLTFPFPDITG
jgi:hypothetical protein